jgi:uncharacterized coiled-coil protein SlyX
MFNILKMRAHIQLLENRLIKLRAHKANCVAAFDPVASKVTFVERDRVVEIDKQINRVQSQVDQYTSRIEQFDPKK